MIKRETVFKLQARKDIIESKVDTAIENVSTKEEDDLKMHEVLDNIAAFDVSIDFTFDPILERYQNAIKALKKEISRIREKLIRLSDLRG